MIYPTPRKIHKGKLTRHVPVKYLISMHKNLYIQLSRCLQNTQRKTHLTSFNAIKQQLWDSDIGKLRIKNLFSS